MPCPVYVIKLNEERLNHLEGIQLAQTATQQILDNSQYKNYLSPEVQSQYFQRLYKDSKGILSYPIKIKIAGTSIDTTILKLISTNEDHWKRTKMPKIDKFTCQAFKTAGSLFEVIDTHTQDVIVPYNDDAKKIIEELDSEISPERCRELLRKAQRYTVSIYKDKSKKLYENHALRSFCYKDEICKIKVIDSDFYDAECGIITENAEHELLIF